MKPAFCSIFASTIALAQGAVPSATVPKTPSQAPALPTSAAQMFEIACAGVEGMLVGAAEAMPEEQFEYVPTGGEFKDVRTFAQQIKHVAAVNFMVGEGISGQKPPVDVKASLQSLKSKAELVQFLKDSFAFARKAVSEMKEAELYTPVPTPFGPNKKNRMMLGFMLIGHGADHYGQMVIYLRHNGIVPPASRR